MKIILILVLLFSLIAPLSHAQSTYTAASSAESDVQAAINLTSSSGGDTVQIPCSGTQNVSWSAALTSSNNFTLTALGATPHSGAGTTGAGTNCLTIRDNFGTIISFTPSYQAGRVLVIQNMNIDPVTSTTPLGNPISITGTCASGGCSQFRLDNIIFGNAAQWTEFGNGSGAAELVHIDDAFGVMDHNTAPPGSDVALFVAQLSSYLGTGLNGDNSWAQSDSLGAANNVFAENNLWNTGHLALNDCEAPGPEGCRYVIRYNTMSASQTGNFGISQNHGTETGGRSRSGREAEVYNNTISCVGACTGVDGGLRGGAGMFFGNHAILFAGQGANNYLGINTYRTVASFNPWGGCFGNGGYDDNDGVTYYTGTITSGGTTLTLSDSTKSWTTNQLAPVGDPYSFFDTTVGFGSEISSNTSTSVTVLGPISEQPWVFSNGDSYEIIRASICIDQPGRGVGGYISGTTPSPTGWVSEALDPIYEFADYATGPANVNNGTIVSGTGKLIQGRDYYSQYLGQTAQTSSTSPFNGTTTCAGSNPCGAGWGVVANRPTTCTTTVGYFATDIGSQGTLYKCLTTNTWTASYTPYTYPHPLTTSPTVTASPTSLSFGSVPQSSTSASQAVTVTNNSGGTITFGSLSFTGTNHTDFTSPANACTSTLTNTSSCSVSVVFTPTALIGTSEIGTINLPYTGAPGSAILVSLAGVSGAPVVIPPIPPASLLFVCAGTHTTCCPALIPLTTQYCLSIDGLFLSSQGAQYAQMLVPGPTGPAGPPGVAGPAGTSGVLSVNSVKPAANGNVTITPTLTVTPK